MALEIPVIADLIARPRRIVRLSPAKKASIAAYESATAMAVQSRKLSKLSSSGKVRKVMTDEDPAQTTAAQDFDRSALASIIGRWESFISSDAEREDIISITTAYLLHQPGSADKYRALLRIMSERQRRGW